MNRPKLPCNKGAYDLVGPLTAVFTQLYVLCCGTSSSRKVKYECVDQ